MEHDDALFTVKVAYWNHLNERHGCGAHGCDEWRNRKPDEACKHTRLIARLMDEKFGSPVLHELSMGASTCDCVELQEECRDYPKCQEEELTDE